MCAGGLGLCGGVETAGTECFRRARTAMPPARHIQVAMHYMCTTGSVSGGHIRHTHATHALSCGAGRVWRKGVQAALRPLCIWRLALAARALADEDEEGHGPTKLGLGRCEPVGASAAAALSLCILLSLPS
eukprot:scaffold9316_cov157-Isochrysis_galbana.AAC.2